jgi:hypothetical protein
MTNLVVPSFHSAIILAQTSGVGARSASPPWREILAVEPDVAVLNAGSLLLTKANYCVTPATSDTEVFVLRHTKSFPLAILSDRLGNRHLGAVAQTIRKQWPRTRILILGEPPPSLEDYLYDEQIYRSSDPRQVLADLEMLYKGMWNQRSNTLDWNAQRASRCAVRSQAIPRRRPGLHGSRARDLEIGLRTFEYRPPVKIEKHHTMEPFEQPALTHSSGCFLRSPTLNPTPSPDGTTPLASILYKQTLDLTDFSRT